MSRTPSSSQPPSQPPPASAAAGTSLASASSLPLSPAGTVAVRFGAERQPAKDLFRRLGLGAARCDLGDQGLYLAEEIVRTDRWMSDDQREALAFLVLAISVAARQGATRVPLDAKGPLPALIADIARAADVATPARQVLQRIRELTTGGHFARAIGGPDQGRPLVVDQGCLYPQRLHWLERRVAAAIAARLDAAGPGIAPLPDATAAVDDVAGRPSDVRLSDEQTAAVRAACASRLAVISGGPGTGKTQIAVAVVRALARLGATRIALAAPTGKAANRLAVSVRRQLAAVAAPTAVDRGLADAPPPALTLHRLLGFRPGDDGFRHHAHNPLPVDAVVVDEASMIDLGLFERLLAAMPAGARLILVGDARQLPSVDAGQVLADLVDIATRSDARWLARLTHSFRMDASAAAGRAVLEAARAIDAGEPARWSRDRLAATRSSAANLTWSGVERIPAGGAAVWDVVDAWWRRAVGTAASSEGTASAGAPSAGTVSAGAPSAGTASAGVAGGELWALAGREYHRRDGAWAAGDREALDRLLAIHERSRLLCTTRSQATGSVAVNRHLHRHMLERASGDREPDFVPGEPVMMTGNDHERGLYNGDPGVIVRVSDDHGPQRYRAVFRRGDDLVPFPLDAVRASLELAWAVTVHKSQGSEWDDVVVILPDDDLPIVTRELIYTALTRARAGAVVVGTKELLDAAARRSAARHSGLADRVLGAKAP